MDILSGLFGIVLILIGGWLWPAGIADVAVASMASVTLLKAGLTVVLCWIGTTRFVNALE